MIKATLILAVAVMLSACVMTNVQVSTPAPIVYQPHYVQPVCHVVDVPVYGYADVYRSHNRHVSIRETAYVERQRRCY